MTAIPTGFARLLQAHESAALVILYYYAAVTCAASYTWFAGDWPKHVCAAVRGVLAVRFFGLLEWPDEQVRLEWPVLRDGVGRREWKG